MHVTVAKLLLSLSPFAWPGVFTFMFGFICWSKINFNLSAVYF